MRNKRNLTAVMHFRALPAERDQIIAQAQAEGYVSTADYMRARALGPSAAPARSKHMEIAMNASERSEIARRAEAAGFTTVDAYVRARLLGRGLEPLTVSQCIMELRKITGLFKHAFTEGHLQRSEGAELLGHVRAALIAVTRSAEMHKPRRAFKSAS